MKDLSSVKPAHNHVDDSLRNWGRWCRPGNPHGSVSPMFREYRSHAWQWHPAAVSIPVDFQSAQKMEQLVRGLPEKHMVATRWAYVHPYIPPGRVRQELGVTKDGLVELLHESRAILNNRL